MKGSPFAVAVSILTLAIPAFAETPPIAAPSASVQTKASQSALKPPDVLKKLKDGNAVESTSGHADSHDKALVAKVSEANVRHSMKEIRDKSAVLKELFDSGAVGLVGAMH